MLRAQKSILVFAVFAVAFVAVLCAAPAFAGEPAQPPAGPPAAIAAAGCGGGPVFAPPGPQAQLCPGDPPEEPPPFFRRTCRCSCGQPCQTDADCGGGICMAGITCC